MKRNNPLALLIVCIALALAPAQEVIAAAGAPKEDARQSGTIFGRVQDTLTGQYLKNVRITVQGTALTVFTDQFGAYLLTQVPNGVVVLEVSYTGIPPQSITVPFPAGGTVEHDISLASPRFKAEAAETVKLDAFEVSASKQSEGSDLAVNEQRYASNIKNIASTDAFGDISQGDIADFMKFLPGVTGATNSFAIRGIGAEYTEINNDGARMANATSQGNSREFQFLHVSINNVSRVEVSKVPTPADAATALGGSINMVTKSAFERTRQQFNFRAYLSANGNALTFRRTPSPLEEYTFKILPCFDFDYTLPISRNFGLVLTGLSSSQWNTQNFTTTNFNAAGTATGASPARPYLQSFAVIDAPTTRYRNSLALRADWRLSRYAVLSVTGQTSAYYQQNGNDTLTFNAGTVGTPTTTGGVSMSYGDNYTIGATGRGALNMSNSFTDISGVTNAGAIRYRFDDAKWRVDGGVDYSKSRTWRNMTGHGHFTGLTVSNLNPVRVTFGDGTRASAIQVFDNNNQPVNAYDLRNYVLTTANPDQSIHVPNQIYSGHVNLRRQFDLPAFPLALQVGGRQQVETRDIKNRTNTTLTYQPPDGNVTPVPFAAQIYRNQKNVFGFDNIQWASPVRAFQAWEKNPNLFIKTPANLVADTTFWITNSQYIKETTPAAYAQAEMRFFKDRLKVLTGVRYEKTTDFGLGPLVDPNAVFVRNADGTFAHNAAGARIRKPEAGAVGSLQELLLTRQERGARSDRTYDGYYPSLHLTHQATEKLLVRAAFARTYGRPNFSDILPNTTINESDIIVNPSGPPGTITINNKALLPWTASNYDVSVEYYTDQGGLFTAGAFRKDIANFFGTGVKLATRADLEQLELDPQYVGWSLNTKFNAGDARITGVEFNVQQPLTPLGGWARYFNVFVNATKLKLQGNQEANFSTFQPFTMNWGFGFSRKPITFTARWNHNGEQRRALTTRLGPDAYTYRMPATYLDLNFTCQVTQRLAFFGLVRNVFNAPPSLLYVYGSQTPSYARTNQFQDTGVYLNAGLKGSF